MRQFRDTFYPRNNILIDWKKVECERKCFKRGMKNCLFSEKLVLCWNRKQKFAKTEICDKIDLKSRTRKKMSPKRKTSFIKSLLDKILPNRSTSSEDEGQSVNKNTNFNLEK